MEGRYFTANEMRPLLQALHDKAAVHPDARFHAYRRGGARFYFEHGMPLDDIKRQGTWRSDAILLYLRDSVPPTQDLQNTITRARSAGQL